MRTFTYKQIDKLNERAIEVEDKVRDIADNIKPKDMRNIPADKIEDIMLAECGYYDMKEVVKAFYTMKALQKSLNLIREHKGIRKILKI